MENRYKVEYIDNNDPDGYSWTLRISCDGKIIEEYNDGGEPEDNYFARDWNWVLSELQRAYKLGFEHGIESMMDNPNDKD